MPQIISKSTEKPLGERADANPVFFAVLDIWAARADRRCLQSADPQWQTLHGASLSCIDELNMIVIRIVQILRFFKFVSYPYDLSEMRDRP